MGSWSVLMTIGFVIMFIVSLIQAIGLVMYLYDISEQLLPWMFACAAAIPLISLIVYFVLPFDSTSHPILLATQPFHRFPISLSRYPVIIAIAVVGLTINAILFHIRFWRPLCRFMLLLTEPFLVISIALIASSFYLQFYVTQALSLWSWFKWPHDFVTAVILRVSSIVLCLVGMHSLVMRPMWRAIVVIYVVARPFLTMDVIRRRLKSRLLEFDRNCNSVDLLLISDLHISGVGTLESNLLPDAMLAWLRKLVTLAKPKAILLCGDITDRGDVDSWNIATELVTSLQVQTVAIPGNHDVHFRRLAETESNSWASYVLDFVGKYFEKLGTGVGSFAADEVLANIKRVSSVDMSGFPQLIHMHDVDVDVLLLDSNRRPSSSAATNAIGHVGQMQLRAASQLVSKRHNSSSPLLIAMHHHVLPTLSADTALLVCDDAGEVLRFALEVDAAGIVHGHTHMPDVTEYSVGTKTILILSCGSALFPARGRREKEVRFPSCFGLHFNAGAIDKKVGLFVSETVNAADRTV